MRLDRSPIKLTFATLMTCPFETGGVKVNFSQNSISDNNETLVLQPKVLELLLVLCAAQGQTLSKQALISTLWPDTIVGPDSLANSITRLRKVLDDDAKNPQFIQTVQRKGYRWLQEVNLSEPHKISHKKIAFFSLSLVFMVSLIVWQLNTKPEINKFPFPDLSIERLEGGGYEVQVGIDGELTEEGSGMVFTVDPIKPHCKQTDSIQDKEDCIKELIVK